jgi:hypothetical protein
MGSLVGLHIAGRDCGTVAFIDEEEANLGLVILLLFLILEFGFVGTWFVLAEPVLDELAWTMVLVGNILEATGMAIYLQLRNTRPALPS